MQDIKFKDIKKYCSKIDRVSICIYETSEYKNYDKISLVPNLYDEKYLYGFGIIESEFGDDLCQCIEFCLSDCPKEKNELTKNVNEK